MIRTAEYIGTHSWEGELLKPDQLSGGERTFRSLPIYAKEHLVCRCNIAYNAQATKENPHGYLGYRTISSTTNLEVRGPGKFCTKCLLPHRFSLVAVLQVCEECDKYYVPDPRKVREVKLVKVDGYWQLRDRYRVCIQCGG